MNNHLVIMAEQLLEYVPANIVNIILDYVAYISWDNIDKHTTNSFNIINLLHICNKCSIRFKSNDSWYRSKNQLIDLDFCMKCWKDYNPIYTYTSEGKAKIEEKIIRRKKDNKEDRIRRRERKIEFGRRLRIKKEKFIKSNHKTKKKTKKKTNIKQDDYDEHNKCISCNDVVYGSDVWFQMRNLICKRCYPTSNSEFILQEPSDYILYTGFGRTKQNLSPVKNRKLPYQLGGEDKLDQWIKYLFMYEIYTDDNFGSVKQWVIFTHLYKIPFFDTYTCLLVDCSQKTNGRIAIMIIDNYDVYEYPYIYYRNKLYYPDDIVNIYIVYENIHDYLKSRDKWQNNILSDEDYKEEFNYLSMNFPKKQIVYGHLHHYHEKLALICKEFSGYIYKKYVNYNSGRYIHQGPIHYYYTIISAKTYMTSHRIKDVPQYH